MSSSKFAYYCEKIVNLHININKKLLFYFSCLVVGSIFGLILVKVIPYSKVLSSRNSAERIIPTIQETQAPVTSDGKVSNLTQSTKLTPLTVSQTDLDPTIDCGPFQKSNITIKVKRSTCTGYVDCGFKNGAWIPEPKDQCNLLQSKDNGTSSPPIPPLSQNVSYNCVIDGNSYTTLGKDLSSAQKDCDDLKTYAKSIAPNTQPIIDPAAQQMIQSNYDNYANQLKQKCADIVASWNSFKKDWYANQYNNYSSSADAITALYGYLSSYQKQLSTANCPDSIGVN